MTEHTIPTYAVIPFRNKLHMTLPLAMQISMQGADVILCDNNADRTSRTVAEEMANYNYYLRAQDWNLTQMWNAGFEFARDRAADHYGLSGHSIGAFNVLFLNNDITVPPKFVETMEYVLRSDPRWWVVSPDHPKDVAIALPETGTDYTVREVADVGAPREACPVGGMCGWAFMVRGENSLFPIDPQFEWWCGDNEVVMSTRIQRGSVGLIEGLHVAHETSSTLNERMDELGPLLVRDIERFKLKYSSEPVLSV